MIGRFEAGGPHAPCRENGSCEEKTRPFPTLTWMKHAGNMHRVSLGCRHGRPRGKRLREASRYRRNATLCDYGVTQGRTTMNTLRRLCGTMPPTHVPHPPISFAVQLLHRNGPYLRVFSKGKTLDRAQDVPAPRGSRCQGFACESPPSASFMHVADIAALRPQACSTLLGLCKMRSA